MQSTNPYEFVRYSVNVFKIGGDCNKCSCSCMMCMLRHFRYHTHPCPFSYCMHFHNKIAVILHKHIPARLLQLNILKSHIASRCIDLFNLVVKICNCTFASEAVLDFRDETRCLQCCTINKWNVKCLHTKFAE